MKKIAVFDLWHPYRLSYSWSMARILSEEFAVSFFTTRNFPQGEEPFKIIRLPLDWPEKTTVDILVRLPSLITTALHCRQILRREDPDLIYFAFDHPLLPCFKLPGVPLVNTAHELDFRQGHISLFNNICFAANLPFCDGIAVMNESYQHRLATLGLRLLRFEHPPFMLRKTLTSDSPIRNFLFFGKIRPDKGLDCLLEACLLLECEQLPFRLTIAGQGNLEAYREGLNRLEPHLIVLNRFIEDTEVEALINGCDVAVLPYRSASQSGVEKLLGSSGMPLILSSALRIAPSPGARIFNSGDARQLAEAMKAEIGSVSPGPIRGASQTTNVCTEFLDFLRRTE